ncbi:S24 family peptidase [Desulfovibrio sp. TomC]|uniref:S24 family peptidase n=1 Tax=Desulfovibrio sp. TomC TaxID=1562888 RepID=UPI0005735FB1|nr:S24 family peptidase [Desulfovibrio sp. TomC]KHK04347.1 putative DNA-binding protein [Desulfovibrio sp. TomC]
MKPDTFEDAYARIQTATRARTQTEIATILGIKQSSISDAKKKNTIPDGWLVTLYRTFALEPDWILYGQMPPSRREGATLPSGVRESAGGYASPPSRVTVYTMACTDPEHGNWTREAQETIPLLESLNRPNLVVVKMDNCSMEPVIRRSAYVGLDCDDIRLRSGEIYALDVPGEGLVIKRVIRDLEKQRLAMLAENPAHQSLYLPLDNPGVATVGKAVWVIQEL